MKITRAYVKRYITREDGSSGCLVPMIMVSDDPESIIMETISYGEATQYTREDVITVEDEDVILDPGGMLYSGEENRLTFEVDGITFQSYWDKLGRIIDHFDGGAEWIPGYKTIKLHLSHLYLPMSLYEKLRDKVMNLNFSPEADAQVERDKAFRRKCLEDGVLGGFDENGEFRTGPGSSEILR